MLLMVKDVKNCLKLLELFKMIKMIKMIKIVKNHGTPESVTKITSTIKNDKCVNDYN